MEVFYLTNHLPNYTGCMKFEGAETGMKPSKLEFRAEFAYDHPQSTGVNQSVSPSLLHRIASGDSSAVQDCLDCYGGLVWTLAKRFLPNQQEAEDAVQEVFIELWKKAKLFDPELASEKTFVAMLARRRFIDKLRKIYRQPNTESIETAVISSDSNNPDAKLDAAKALEMFKDLKPEQQKCLRLSILTGLSHSEISEVISLPIGTVKSHIRRGLIAIRDRMSRRSGNFGEGGSP